MALPNGENLRPLPPSMRRFIAVILGCIFVGLCSLWVHNFDEEDPISSVHYLARVNSDLPIDFVWKGWDGVSQHYWEYDYFRELFPPPQFVHVNSSIAPGIMLCNEANHANGEMQHAINGHIKVIIQSGDEFGGKNDNCNECFKAFKAGKSFTK